MAAYTLTGTTTGTHAVTGSVVALIVWNILGREVDLPDVPLQAGVEQQVNVVFPAGGLVGAFEVAIALSADGGISKTSSAAATPPYGYAVPNLAKFPLSAGVPFPVNTRRPASAQTAPLSQPWVVPLYFYSASSGAVASAWVH